MMGKSLRGVLGRAKGGRRKGKPAPITLASVPTLTTRVSGGALAVYRGRAKIGYVQGDNGRYLWELILVSEQLAGHPRGVAESREQALADLEKMFDRWLGAAELVKGDKK